MTVALTKSQSSGPEPTTPPRNSRKKEKICSNKETGTFAPSENCPAALTPFVVLMKIETKKKYGNKYDKTSPSAARETREGLPGFPGSGCDGQMASAQWVHSQSSSDGCQS